MENKKRDPSWVGLEVLEALSSAVEDASLWPQFLNTAMRATGASRGVLTALSSQLRGRLWISQGISDQAADQWYGYFRHIDPKLSAGRLPARGEYAVNCGEDLVPDEVFLQTEFYKDFAAPHQMRWSRTAWLRPDAPHAFTYGLLLFRGVDETNFDEGAVTLLDLVMRRLQSHERIGVANALSRAAGLGDEGAAVFLLNGQGGLVLSNQRAADMISSGSVLDNGKSISFVNPNANAWLSALISDRGLDSKAFGAAARQRESLDGFGSVQFALYPFEQIGSTLSLNTARYALTLKPVEAKAVPDLARAAHQMYRWTSAELDTVRRLSAGDELPSIAVARECSVETVRSHLKNAKRKAGVKRQVDLVRLMIALES